MSGRRQKTPTAELPITEDSLAVAFANEHANRARYEHDSGLWLLWDGARWRANRTRLAVEWVRELCRGYAVQAGGNLAKDLGRTAVIHGVERLAQSDTRLALLGSQLDADPLLLGTPDGTVELGTGDLRKARPGDLISRCTAVGPAPEGREPVRWLRFLGEATGGDGMLQQYLRVMAGYCLTGQTREQCLFFVWGQGGNGKTVFINTLRGIMGDYAVASPMETFTERHGERHETELAMLRGARLVTAAETDEGRGWAEARIKQLTGSDPITARFMRRDFFTYLPAFKLVIYGNHKPALRSVDRAMARRFRMLPFVHEPANPDKDLELRLREEWPEILSWAIGGCVDWMAEDGFPDTPAVSGATEDYLSDQDLIGQWIEADCESAPLPISAATMSPGFRTAVRLLFRAFFSFCEQRNEKPYSEKRFVQEVEKRGYLRVRGADARMIVGLRLTDAAVRRVGVVTGDGL